MNRTFRHLAATSTVIVVLLLSAAVPAAAHPYVHGGELPVDSLATMDLDLAHGCDPGHAGDEQVTTEVAIEVPGWLRIVEVGEARYLGVFQGCDGTSHRWIGTDEEPADEPAIGVTLTEADPSSPPPPPEAADDGGTADGAGGDGGPSDDAADDGSAPTGLVAVGIAAAAAVAGFFVVRRLQGR